MNKLAIKRTRSVNVTRASFMCARQKSRAGYQVALLAQLRLQRFGDETRSDFDRWVRRNETTNDCDT